MPAPHWFRGKKRALAMGYKSGLEESTAADLKARGVHAPYESVTLEYEVPASKHKYTPDFPLPNGIYIETKGRFTVEDRKKHLHIKQSRPDLDIRFVFNNPNAKLRKGSPTSYAMWCEKNGFLWAAKRVPDEWIKEKPKRRKS
jgi:hypothetical protein